MDPVQTPQDQTNFTSQQSGEAQSTASAPKQQIVAAINEAKNVLVTVAANPSVDGLAAALGLTFLLGKLDKHATALFSGVIPPAIEFLQPNKTFESNVDSLRDFIIALDKDKADKLKYKVEDQVVKVFITPYRTTITEKDLQFSQGDYNVDVVVAIGVHDKGELDAALSAHGRILHDATVVTINNDTPSNLGSIDWTDGSASSVAEMLMSMSEALGGGLLDGQISTAFLTGIVASTNRFSNDKTTPKVMTMAAQLMAAGANQQLIASNLRKEGMISEPDQPLANSAKPVKKPNKDGELKLDHQAEMVPAAEVKAPKPEVVPAALPAEPAAEPIVEPVVELVTAPIPAPVSDPAPAIIPAVKPEEAVPPPLQHFGPPTKPLVMPPAELDDRLAGNEITQDQQRAPLDKPTFGGTLNATTSEAEQATALVAAQEQAANQTALSHDSPHDAQGAIEAARQAVQDAAGTEFNPANNPQQGIGVQGMMQIHDVHATAEDGDKFGEVTHPPRPTQDPSWASTTSPTEIIQLPPSNGFAPASDLLDSTPSTAFLTNPNPISGGSMPPMPPPPPMPGGALVGSIPPTLGDQSYLDSTGLTVAMQPQTTPDFTHLVNQSQNEWSQAADDLAAQQAAKNEQAASRQQRIETMTADYDAALQQNQQLQNPVAPPSSAVDHTTFPLPPSQ